MMKRIIPILAAFAASSTPAFAATGNVTFSGRVDATCSLLVTNASGEMTPSASLQTLSSKNSGGRAGRVTLTTTGGVVLSVDAVTVSTQPPGDLTPTTWTPSYLMSGVQTIPEASAPTTIASPGTGAIEVHLTATKTGTNSFVSGNYTGTVTVRCEP